MCTGSARSFTPASSPSPRARRRARAAVRTEARGAARPDAASGGAGGATGAAAGTTGGAGTGAAGKDAGAIAVTDAAGATSDATAPHYGDGGVTAVAATPPADWTSVTANLAGMTSECGNTPYLVSHPATDMLITSVAKQGLWASTDGATSWKQLWSAAGTMQITNRGFVDRLRSRARRDAFWESGIYNGPRRLSHDRQRRDVFAALGDAHHIDSVSVDLLRPAAHDAARGRPRAEADALSLDGQRRDLDERGPQAALGLELLHERARHRQEHTPSSGARATRAAPTASFARRTAASDVDAPHGRVGRLDAALGLGRDDLLGALIYDNGLIKSTDQGNLVDAAHQERRPQDRAPHRAARRAHRRRRPEDAHDLDRQG